MPTLLLATGFEHGINNTTSLIKGNATIRYADVLQGSPAITSSTPRTGGFCLEINTTAAAERLAWDSNTLGANGNNMVVGFGLYFPSALPTADVTLMNIPTTSATIDFALKFRNSDDKLILNTSTDSGTAAPSANAMVADTWYWIDIGFAISGTAWTVDWAIDTVAQTQFTHTAPTTDQSHTVSLGTLNGVTYTCRFDDLVVSKTGGDYPLGKHTVRRLTADTGGTATEIGTANATSRFINNSTADATFNSANILAALTDGPPPTLGGTASGVCQRTAGVGNAAQIPMTSYTLAAGETISGMRVEAVGWAASATTNSYGLRVHNGTTEDILQAAADLNFDADTAAPGWLCKMVTAANYDTQAEIDAFNVRVGYSNGDVNPLPGFHAIYAALAVKESTSVASIPWSGQRSVYSLPSQTVFGQRPLESPPGLLGTAQLEVPGPTSTWETAVTHQRLPWLRQDFYQVDQGSAPAAPADIPEALPLQVAVTHYDRRLYPQQRLLESPPGLLATAQLEVPSPLPLQVASEMYDRRLVPQQRERESPPGLLEPFQLEVPPPPELQVTVTHQRPAWLRTPQTRYDQSSAAVAAFDPTQAGYSTRPLWRRDPYPPTQRAAIANPDEVSIVGIGATVGWWGMDDTAHHFAQWLPQTSIPAAAPAVPFDPTQAGYGNRAGQVLPSWAVYIAGQLRSYTQFAAPVVTFDPTLAGYSMRPLWRRSPYPPIQRTATTGPDTVGIVGTGQTMGWWGVDDSAHHFGQWLPQQLTPEPVPAVPADPTLFGYGNRAPQSLPSWLAYQVGQIRRIYDQSTPNLETNPLHVAWGDGGNYWHLYNTPSSHVSRDRMPPQRDRESVPGLLGTALLEDALLGAVDDLMRHRTWHSSRRLVPQQRNYYQYVAPPQPADPLLVVGAEWRIRYAPATHAPRWVLRLQIRYPWFIGGAFPPGIVGNVYPPPWDAPGSGYPVDGGAAAGGAGPASGTGTGSVYPRSSGSIIGRVG